MARLPAIIMCKDKDKGYDGRGVGGWQWDEY